MEEQVRTRELSTLTVLSFIKKAQFLWCKYCVHMCENGKMRPVETIPGMGEGEYKGV
jgi:hypothetical protein